MILYPVSLSFSVSERPEIKLERTDSKIFIELKGAEKIKLGYLGLSLRRSSRETERRDCLRVSISWIRI